MINVEDLNIYIIKIKTDDKNIQSIFKKVKNAEYFSSALDFPSYFSEVNTINSGLKNVKLTHIHTHR